MYILICLCISFCAACCLDNINALLRNVTGLLGHDMTLLCKILQVYVLSICVDICVLVDSGGSRPSPTQLFDIEAEYEIL